MIGALVKGTTVLFDVIKSMITNTSLPHSALKKHVPPNNYHCVRENQQFPPVLTAGECKIDLKKPSMDARYVHTVLSPLDLEVISSFVDE
eukprot:350837-Ditylum_brightwellii.AAC.1